MSAQVLRFTCTKITAGSSKAGLTPDKDGYFNDLVFGAFDITTPSRQHFPMAGVEKLLAPGSPLHRRATNGALKGEWGHPKQMPGEQDADYVRRISMVEEKNTAIHIREFRIVPVKDKNGKTYYQVRGDVAPSGPYGDCFAKAMANPHENIGLSIRGMSRDVWQGTTMVSTFTRIFTWDVVTEPGVPEANKMDSVNMQQLSSIEIPVSDLLSEGEPTELGVTFLSSGIDLHELIANCAEDVGTRRDSRSW